MNHPLALVLVLAGARVGGEHRGVRLLDLQEQRIVLAVAHQQDHHRLGPDRADADDLAREILVVVVVEHDAPIGAQRARIVGESLADDLLEVVGHRLGRAHDHRRLLLDPVAAVDRLRVLRQRAQARSRLRLRKGLLKGLDRGLLQPGCEIREQLVRVEPRVPDIQEAHPRRLGHRRPIGRGGSARRRPLLLATVAVVAGGDDDARHEALDVPLKRRRQRLIEVVEIEDNTAIRRREHAEVRQVRIAATLHTQPGRRGAREIARHDRRGPAVERERRDDHPAVPDRHELGHARRVLLSRMPTGSGR